MIKTISTDKAPAAIGPYSQAKVVGDFVFTSGQIAINPETAEVEATTIEGQTKQICENIKNLLEASGSNLENVVKTTCFLKNMEDFTAFNAIYAEYFTSKQLPKDVLVEVETIAIVK